MRYKVGDRVLIKSIDWYNENKTIHGDIWFDNAVFVGGQSLYCGCELTIRLVTNDSYYVIENDYYWIDEMIEGLVEEETKPNIIEEAKTYWDSIKDAWICPEGYIFKDENGNIINATKIVLEKKKKEYPKTYEECLSILGIYNGLPDVEIYNAKPSECELFESLIRLKRCRDAYWKIYGEEMGLGKPWAPDWNDEKQNKYGFYDEVKYTIINPAIFVFPTEEMRDAFKENFNPDIEICKN